LIFLLRGRHDASAPVRGARREVQEDAPGTADFSKRFCWRLGTVGSPDTRSWSGQAAHLVGLALNVKQGGPPIEYEGQDPRIRRMFEKRPAKRGILSRVDDVVRSPART
jgi:hypothetical protein